MKAWLRTRKIGAKIDRGDDLYDIVDRLSDAIRDIDGDREEIENRLHALEQERVKFITDTGLQKKLEIRSNRETAKLSKKVLWWLIGGLGGAGSALLLFVSKHIEWK